MEQRKLVSTRDGSLGRALAGMANPLKVRSVGGKALAMVLMTAQLTMGPRLQGEPKPVKRTSAQRRRARIEAGKLKVEGGRLVGG